MLKSEYRHYLYRILYKCLNLSYDRYGYDYTFEIINELQLEMVILEQQESTPEIEQFYEIICEIHDKVLEIQATYESIKKDVKNYFDTFLEYYSKVDEKDKEEKC